MKYLLYKTGKFPRYEPNVSDVLDAANAVHEVKDIKTPNGRNYFYVIPLNMNLRNLGDMLRIFRANGIILLPHHNGKYDGWVFRVPNRNQQFMQDVMRVNNNHDEFKNNILPRYAIERQH